MNTSSTPLLDALQVQNAAARSSFHTPGHKANPSLSTLGGLSLDVTELPATGSLFDGGDCIEQSERLAAAAFGAAQSFFSAGGCTLCIQTMLMLSGNGKTVLMARNAHRSAVHTAALLGITVEWLPSRWTENGISLPTDDKTVEDALIRHPSAGAVYLTSPDYYGRLCDIDAIAAVCRRFGVLLLVDNAHGSHLDAFDRHPLALGADMTADSCHKTLPVLTGGALLHIGVSTTFSRESVKSAMGLFASTSPSYPIMASLDYAQAWWRQDGADAYRQTAVKVAPLLETARKKQILAFPDADPGLLDPCRLTLDVAEHGGGIAAADFFRAGGCEPELADDRFVVFIITPFNTDEDILRLHRALERFTYGGAVTESSFSAFGCRHVPQKVLSIRQATMAAWEEIPLQQAAGRIAARTVCPCPPGVAVIVPGERYDEAIASYLLSRGYTHVQVTVN